MCETTSNLRILAVILDDDDDDDDDDEEETTTILFIFFAYFCDFCETFCAKFRFSNCAYMCETTSNFCFKRGNPLIVCKRAVCDAETSHYTEPDFVHHLCERNRDFE